MGSGSDVAQQFSGVLLIGDDLRKLADLIEFARRCRGVILFNFAGTLLVDAAGTGMAAFQSKPWCGFYMAGAPSTI
jgi:cation transport ATPase